MMTFSIRAMVPDSVKVFVKKWWQKIKPPRVKLTKFIDDGCVFEITTKIEKFRVTRYGDEADSILRVLSEIRDGDVFFDIGSCIGIYGLHAALKGCKVIAFEPDPEYRKKLWKNTKINKLQKKVKIINWAVSDTTGETTLYTDGINGRSPSLQLNGDRKSVKVTINTIDNAISKGEIPLPNLLKMDIEGAEILALRGMERTLSSKKSPRFLFIELHPNFLPNFNSSVEECIQLIESYGYVQDYFMPRLKELHYAFRKV